jgi:hypothetical protein
VKTCTKCKQSKGLECFTIDRSRRDGLNLWCRACCSMDYKSKIERARKHPLTHKRLLELLHFNPETGVFTWKITHRGRVKAGSIAGGPHSGGCLEIRIGGGRYRAHRLAWFYVHKRWPKREIDHIDLDPTNNVLNNLREATHQQNMCNVGLLSTNKTGFRGVSYCKSKGKFVAQIEVKGEHKFLGHWPIPEMAALAYAVAAHEYHGYFARS